MLYSHWKKVSPWARKLILLVIALVAGMAIIFVAHERLWIRMNEEEARKIQPIRLPDNYKAYRSLAGDVLAFSGEDDVCYIIHENRLVVALKADEVTRDWGRVVFTWHGWSDVAHLATDGGNGP